MPLCDHRTLLGQVMGAHSSRTIVATGGGARSELWLQIRAAVLGATMVKPRGQELACLGAALLAGVGAGIFQGLDEASHAGVREEVRFVPEPGLLNFYREWNPSETGHQWSFQ